VTLSGIGRLERGNAMPWQAKDASRHTKKAKSAIAKRQWGHVANSMLKSGKSEGAAVRAANAAVKKRRKKG
jgi:uncharacterized protein YdaT